MSDTLVGRLTSTPEGMKHFQQERAIIEAAGLICRLMDEHSVNRTELARRLGRSKGYVTQLLSGGTNMTVRTISDVLFALESSLHFASSRLGVESVDCVEMTFAHGPATCRREADEFLDKAMLMSWASAEHNAPPPCLDTGDVVAEYILQTTGEPASSSWVVLEAAGPAERPPSTGSDEVAA